MVIVGMVKSGCGNSGHGQESLHKIYDRPPPNTLEPSNNGYDIYISLSDGDISGAIKW